MKRVDKIALDATEYLSRNIIPDATEYLSRNIIPESSVLHE